MLPPGPRVPIKTSAANRRAFALDILASQIEDARAEIREHQGHVDQCEMRLAVLLISQEAVQASQSPETDQ